MYVVNWKSAVSCVDHGSSTCRCTMEVSWTRYPDLQSIIVPRIKNDKVLTYIDQLFEVIRYIMEHFYFSSAGPARRPQRVIDSTLVLDAAFEFFSTECNQRICPLFTRNNVPSFMGAPVSEALPFIIKSIDQKWLADLRLDNRGAPGTLQRLCYDRISLYNTFYGTFNGYRAVVNTADNMSSEKIAKLYAEFSGPGTSRGNMTTIKKLIPRAIKYLEKALNVEKNQNIVTFKYHSSMLSKFVTSPMTASGIRPGSSENLGLIGGTRLIKTVNGKKFDQFPYYSVRFNEAMKELYTGGMQLEREKNLFETYCYISLKNEMRYCWPVDQKEVEELVHKCREFFIPNMFQQFLSRLLMTPRQKLERGDYIRIGQKWNYGGAQDFAKFLHAGNPKICWHTGDFKKLDKTIKDYLLGFYVTSGQRYFTVSSNQRQFLEDLFVILCEKVVVKLVNHIGGVWTVMKAFMYSGGFETSHGDSWCVLLIWFCYIVHTMEKFPARAHRIEQTLLILLRIVVYGDDHVWCTPIDLADILNENMFGLFVKEYFDMTIRDAQLITDFFSEIYSNGELKKPGVVFLKRYFLFQDKGLGDDYPVVWPFKPTHDSLLKLFYSKDNLDVTFVLQSIGQAYDTLGTNNFAYDRIREFYEFFLSRCQKPLHLVLEEAFSKMDYVSVTNLIRRTRITRAELSNGFPSLELLLSLHKRDAARATNKIEYTSFDELYDLDIEDPYFGINEDEQEGF